MSTTLITSRDKPGRHAVGLFEVAYNQAGLDKDRAQRLNENGGEFQDGLAVLIERLSATNQFADEEKESSFGYLSGYTMPKPLGEQVKLLQAFFPNLGAANETVAAQVLPSNTEGWFAIPRWQLVGKTYEEALLKAFEQIKLLWKGKFHNYREGNLGPARLRLVPKTAKALEALGQQQKGYDILVVPCQFGLRHRGRSVRRARAVMSASEFGLDPFSVACMLLTHPERLQDLNDLWIDCPGADYDFDGDGQFDGAPFFGFGVGKVEFDSYDLSGAYARCGSASALLSQCEA